MGFLLLATIGSGVIPVIFRAFTGWRVNLFWAIPVNYLTCVAVGQLLATVPVASSESFSQPWIGLAAFQGMLLAVNFYLLAETAQRAGVAVAALASRLSVAIPSLLAFVLYGERLTAVKGAGLIAALLALYLCTTPERGSPRLPRGLWRLSPVLVFITFGAYFSILKYLETHYLEGSFYHAYVGSAFLFAFVTSVLVGLGKGLFSAAAPGVRHLLAGTLLGVINYIAVYALLRVLALEDWESSQLFPMYSVGVVAVSTVLAKLLFHEPLARRKALGLAVGLGAVLLLQQGPP